MILDYLLMFDTNATVTGAAGTYSSTNILDLHISSGGLPVLANLQGARDMGIGDKPALKLLVQVITAFAGGTSLAVNFQGATDNGSGAPAAFSTYYSSPAIALASLVAGARLMDIDVPRPPAGVAIPRFLRLTYTTLGTMSAGAITAGIVINRQDQAYQGTANSTLGGYPAGITIAN